MSGFYIKSVIFRRYVPQEAGNLRNVAPPTGLKANIVVIFVVVYLYLS